MVKSLLSSPQLTVLEQALSASSLRHKVISNNIANVNTPGFKKSEVTFETTLQEAIDGKKLPLAQTNERHFGTEQQGSGLTAINTVDNTMRTDKNNVDIDIEMANLSKNNIYYDAVAQQLSRYFTNLKTAIKGS